MSRSALALLIAALLVVPALAQAAGKDDEVTRMDFILMMAKNQKQSKLIPSDASSMPEKQLYDSIVRNLKKNGFNILSNKNPEKPLSQQEFVRLTYAFSDQPAGVSLFAQKQYLKEAQIISSADVGLTTGLDGRVAQYRDDENSWTRTELATPVYMQDRVETDLGSMVTFTFDDGSELSLGEDAVVNITEHIYDPERDFRKTIVKVMLGAVRFKVTKGKAEGSMFKVLTPVATAGVRGTEFVTVVGKNGETEFVGLEGKIETFPVLPDGSEGKHEFVVAGTMQKVSDAGKSSGVKQASAEFLQNVFNKTNPKKKMKGSPKVTLAKAIAASQGDLKLGKALGKTKDKAQGLAKGHDKTQQKGKGVGKDKGKPEFAGKGAGKGKPEFAGTGDAGAAKQAAQSAAKSVAKDAVRNSARKAAKDAVKTAALDSAKESVKNSVKQVTKTSGNLNGGNPNPAGNPNVVSNTPGVGGALPPGQGGVPPGLAGGFPGQGNGPPCGIPPCGNANGHGNGNNGNGNGNNGGGNGNGNNG